MGGREQLRQGIRELLREPLVHFLLAGFAIFLVSAWRGEAVDPASRVITIDEGQVARLSAGWEQTWRRPPDPTEMDALIRDYIKEEIYYREAKRIGLDDDDNVIRRRLRSKMEYLAKAQVESARPDHATLSAWLAKYPARFAPDAAYSLDQIYLGPDGDGKAIRKSIDGGADWTLHGQAISLPKSLEKAGKAEIERQFGVEFARSIAELTTGKWEGPVNSGFGKHLVRVRQVDLPPELVLSDVRQAVENDWRSATYKQREASAYQALLDGYTISIAKP
jgi:peptidyl-prolyl cis-trans isomerase C